MRTLLLLRHGKAVAAEPDKDHDRALAPRGRQQADTIATLLARLGLQPEVALVSDARRTVETAEHALAGSATEIAIEPTLYAASAETLLDRARAAPDTARRVMLVGHNPGIGELARLLEGSGEPQAVIALHEGFPTGTLAVFEFDAESWTALKPGSGSLTRFIVPERGTDA